MSCGCETIVIDVRSKEEFKEGHVKNSLNIPLDDIYRLAPMFLKKTKNVIFVCAGGGRSTKAVEFLTSQGVTNISDGGSWGAVAKRITS